MKLYLLLSSWCCDGSVLWCCKKLPLPLLRFCEWTASGMKCVAATLFNVNDKVRFVPDCHVLRSSWLFVYPFFFNVVSSVRIFTSTHASVSDCLHVCECVCPCVCMFIDANVSLSLPKTKLFRQFTVFRPVKSFHHISEDEALYKQCAAVQTFQWHPVKLSFQHLATLQWRPVNLPMCLLSLHSVM